MQNDEVFSIDELRIWVEPGSSVHLKIASAKEARAELSGDQARKLAGILLQMADEADA